MNSFTDAALRWLPAIMAVWMRCVTVVAAEDGLPIENLRLPIDHYPDGTIKTQLKAVFARVPPSGAIVASNVVVELFREDASLDAVIRAEKCRYDKEKRIAESESAIRIERNGVIISGQGFEWNGAKERVRILSMAKVLFTRDLSRTGEALQSGRKEQP